MSAVESVRWSADGGAVDIIDQRLLPGTLVRRELRSADDVCDAILTLAVRGAPAIGVAGAMGLVVALAPHVRRRATRRFLACVDELGERIARVRPTAVNLSWADRPAASRARARRPVTPRDPARRTARRSDAHPRRGPRDVPAHRRARPRRCSPEAARVLTHCNAGALATGGIGTALAPVYRRRRARAARPRLRRRDAPAAPGQPAHGVGAHAGRHRRHRALRQHGGVGDARRRSRPRHRRRRPHRRQRRRRQQDRHLSRWRSSRAPSRHPVLRRGADEHGRSRNGDRTTQIPIEHRPADELARGFGAPVTPDGVAVYNPAFDVTPAELVTAIITDRGRRAAAVSLRRRGARRARPRGREEDAPNVRPRSARARRSRSTRTALVSPPAAAAATSRRSCRSSPGRAHRERCSSARRPGRSRRPVASRSPAARAGRSSAGSSAPGLDEPTARDVLYIAAITRCYPGSASRRSRRSRAFAGRAGAAAPIGWMTSFASSGRR